MDKPIPEAIRVSPMAMLLKGNTIKPKDCPNCLFRQEGFRENGGHCYMFRADYIGKHCAQFESVKNK